MLHCPTVLAAPAVRVCILTFLLSEPFWEMHWTSDQPCVGDPGVRNSGRLSLVHPKFGSHSKHRHVQNTNLCLHVQTGRDFWFLGTWQLLGCVQLSCQCLDIGWCCSVGFCSRSTSIFPCEELSRQGPEKPLLSVWLHPHLIYIFFSCYKILLCC